jgi:hypothetical protein
MSREIENKMNSIEGKARGGSTLIGALALVVGAIWAFAQFQPDSTADVPANFKKNLRSHAERVVESTTRSAPDRGPAQTVKQPMSTLKNSKRNPGMMDVDQAHAWFKDLFQGRHFDLQFRENRLVRVQNKKLQHASLALSEAEIKRRTDSLVKSLEKTLGLAEGAELKFSESRRDQVSQTIYYDQSYGGVKLEPWGRVTVQWLTSGELISMDSNVLPAVVTSESKMSEESEIREQLKVELENSGDSASSPISPGRLILWSTGELSGDQKLARYAYSYQVAGFHWVLDAQTKKVLERRDHRKF